jgi:hypothetical protein
MVQYANPILSGLNRVSSLFDGYTINLTWRLAYPEQLTNKIVQHIYFATERENVISEGVKYVIIDDSLTANIIDLTPGQDYWWLVRPVEYNPEIITFLSNLPIAFDNVRFYPTSLLSQNISATDLIIPLIDTEGFPDSGIVKIGIELIQYLAISNNNLIVPNGTNGTPAHLILQSNDEYYIPNLDNVGLGTINDLTLTNLQAPNDTWKVICVGVEQSDLGTPIRQTAKFEIIGDIYGNVRDQYTNSVVWTANNEIVNSVMFSFSITELDQFAIGDYYTITTAGATLSGNSGRGFNNTPITMHTVSGFDGYYTYNPLVSIMAITEDDRWDNIYACQSRFDYPNFPFTILDGYDQVSTDLLSTNYSAADAANVSFPQYDYSGYHRTDPVLLLNGTCVGSYIGGQMGCIDGYGNYNIVRGLSLENQNTQRQDILLSLTGQPACLIRRVQTGIICSCYLSSSEYPDDRCPFCLGGKFVLSYEQYFNPRQSDGRIMVRLGPTAENLKMYEAGFESEFPVDIWTLTVPTIKTRDVLILFDQDDNETFRYEVAAVTRNNTILGLDGGQKLNTFRVRKTDPIYQISAFRNTSTEPQLVNTSLGMAVGIPPHSHVITTNENDPTTWSQLTQVSQGHNHEVIVINGKLTIKPILGHTHTIV